MAQFPREIDMQINTSWATVRPGDTLVIAVQKNLSRAEAEDMRDRFQELLHGVMVIVVPANQLLVYRPETFQETAIRNARQQYERDFGGDEH